MDKKTERIIIVDDEKRMCDSLSALLTGDGYEVKAFQQSPKAADFIRKNGIDLVITDLKMPELGGLEILQVVKEVDSDIPVILITGYASLESAIEAVAHGAYDYLLKPVEFNYLELAVNRALEKRRSGLERLQLVEELKLSNMVLKSRMEELNALYEAGKSIGSTANLNELLRQIVVLASTVTEAQVGSIMLLDEHGEYLTIEAAIGLDDGIVASTKLPVGESIAGTVAQNGKPLIVKDVEESDRFKRINKEKYGSASLLCCPLHIKNKVIGVINMANKQSGETFSENDLRLLTTFASQAAIAVDDANQFEKNRRRMEEFKILHEISTELPNLQSLSDFRMMLIDKLIRIFPIDYSIWFNWDKDSRMLVPRGSSGKVNFPLTDSGSIDLRRIARDSICIGPIDTNDVDFHNIDDLSSYISKRLSGRDNFPQPKQSYMAMPILRGGELAHVFYIGSDREKPYSDDDISMARLVISQASLLFEKERSLLNATRLITMGNMMSEISHDLRRPLTSIKGSLQILKMKHPELTADSELFITADEEVHHMNELIRELVNFSDPNRYNTEKVDLRKIVIQAVELIGPDLRKKGIKYNSNFEDVEWDIIINKNQILEALLNLFMNAIDAMSDGGNLKIQGLIEKPDHKKQDYLALKIIDNGKGIKKENLSRIFDRYFTSKDTGTGLGLAVVDRIISAHNGTLSVVSKEGAGSTFTLYFPYQ
ncbi:MAG: GAF domain-containing protein [candidate division Zixibacteria bacterium]|nr:GAF domain-containing protein [candidate division Zixibacteria bacterium]